jgi:protease-4
LGLIDALGGYDTAQGQIRDLLKLEATAPLDLVALPEPKAPWQKLARIFGGGAVAEDDGVRALLGAARVLAPMAERLQALDPQAGALMAPMLPRQARP